MAVACCIAQRNGVAVMLDVIATNADAILAVVSAIFSVSLLPTILEQWKGRQSSIPLSSSVLTFAGLAMIVVVYAALGLWYAMSMGSLIAASWAVIALQRFFYGSPEKD